jgi:hypothetical protein
MGFYSLATNEMYLTAHQKASKNICNIFMHFARIDINFWIVLNTRLYL